METLTTPSKTLIPPSFLMNTTISTTLKTKLKLFNYSKFQTFCLSSLNLSNTQELISSKNGRKRVLGSRVGVKAKASDAAELKAELKKKYLDSLSCPLPEKGEEGSSEGISKGGGVEWVIGIDPDLSGALAVIKSDSSGYSAEVFDNPYVQVLVGKRVRKRLDTRSIVQLLQRFDAPVGTTAYIEQSIPFPQDGKQGWWSGGFGYGLWIGVLVASGFNVVPVPSLLWKNHYELSGSRTSKDDSRKAAAMLFPSLSSLMKRKKDHGRAEALLIAAYGKGLRLKPDPETTPDPELVINRDLMIIPDLCTALTC